MNILDKSGRPAQCDGDPTIDPKYRNTEGFACHRKVSFMLTSMGELEEDAFYCGIHVSPYDGFYRDHFVVGYGNYPIMELVAIR